MSATSQLMPMSAIQTPRLVLRKVTMEDRDAIFAWARDPDVTQYGSWDAHCTLHDTETFLEACLKQYEREGLGPWGIELSGTGEIIGTCGFGYVDRVDRRGGMGYFLGKRYWGQGLATEAARAVLRFGFGPMALNRIEARCMTANVASERVMQKVGMRFEGVLRQDMYKAGAFHDVKLYARLAGDTEPPL